MGDSEIVELEREDAAGRREVRLERDGAVVITTGPDGRPRRTQHPTPRAASEALAAAVQARERDGYFPADGSWPLPVACDPESDELLFVPVPEDPHGGDTVRNALPVQLEGLRERYGEAFDAPGDRTLWFPGTLHVGRRHHVREVVPRLAGPYTAFPFWHRGFPGRPDDGAVLVGHAGTLYELDLDTARAAALHRFAGDVELAQHQPFLYAADGRTVLWCDQHTLVALPRGGAPAPALSLGGSRILDAVRLVDGRIVLLQETQLTVVRLADGGAEITHEMPVAAGQALGTWLGGRVLIVATGAPTGRASVAIAVHDDGLRELSATAQPVTAGFDLHGAQWLVLGSQPGTTYRACGAERAWREARARPVLARDHTIGLAPLHDTIAAIATGAATLELLAARLVRPPELLEVRAYQEGWTPLGYAAWRGLEAIAAALIEAGAELDAVSRSGRPPLATALERGHLRLAEALAARGARGALPPEIEVDGQHVRTESPVVAAARVGQHDLVLALLDAGAAIDATGHDGATALTGAAARGHVALAHALLDRGARPDAIVPGGPSPLEGALAARDVDLVRRIAATGRDVAGPIGGQALRNACLSLSVRSVPREIVDVLVEHGAHTTTPQALHYAIEARHAGAVRAMLAAGADPNAPYVTASSPSLPLQLALFVADPDRDIVEALLTHGAAVDALDQRGVPALNDAVANAGDPALVARLLDAGAPVAPVGAAWGALHQAAWSGRVALVDVLLAHGAPIDGTTASGRAALSMAAENDQHDALRHLLDAGADPDAGAWTALMAAAVRDDVEMVEVLLDAGADPARTGVDPRPGKGDAARTAQAHAELARARRAAARLGERAGTGPTTLHAALATGDLGVVAATLARGASPDERRADTGTPAIHAAPTAAALELLLARGADPCAVDRAGRTALFAAAAAGDLDRMEILLARGVDPAHVSASGATALHDAVAAGHLAATRRLLAAGCPAEGARPDLVQPLHLAARRDDRAAALLLLDAGARVAPVAPTIHGGFETPLHVAAEHGAVAVADLLLARGADPAAGADPDGEGGDAEHDEAYWAEGGFTPVHRAAQRGRFEVLVTLLRADRAGARFVPTVRGQTAEDLAAPHPRCRALLAALAAPGATVDGALAALADADGAAAAAEADGRLWVERVTEPLPDGTGHGPPAVIGALGRHDWVRTAPGAAYSLVLRFVRGLHEVAVGDAAGVHALPVSIRAQRTPYSIDADGARFLVSDGRAVFVVDGPGRTAREVVPAEALPGEVTEVGWLADGALFVVAGGRVLAFGPGATPWWSVPAGDLRETHATGTPLVALVLGSNVLRVVWARFDPDGVRPYAWLDDRIVLLTPTRSGDRVDGVAYSGWSDPRVYRLHHLEGAPADGPARAALPGPEVFTERPRLSVRTPPAAQPASGR